MQKNSLMLFILVILLLHANKQNNSTITQDNPKIIIDTNSNDEKNLKHFDDNNTFKDLNNSQQKNKNIDIKNDNTKKNNNRIEDRYNQNIFSSEENTIDSPLSTATQDDELTINNESCKVEKDINKNPKTSENKDLLKNDINTKNEEVNEIKTSSLLSVNDGYNRYLISSLTHALLALNGLYILFFGFRFFRLSMIVLGFFVSYYSLIIFISHTSFFKPENEIHEVCILLISIIFGFIFSLLTFTFETANYIVFGSAAGFLSSIFYAQFFLDFSTPSDKFIMFGIYLIISIITVFASIFYLHETLIVIYALVGSIAMTINIGIITNAFVSFENRDKLHPESYDDFINYLVATTVLLIAGIIMQFFIRQKIINNLKNRKLEEIRGIAMSII